jgi:drug/metabolite transporter (DMT)-like permease
MALGIIFIASLLAACANFFLKKNEETKGTAPAFLVNYYLFSLATSILLTPSIFSTPWNKPLTLIGGFGGFLNVAMLGFTAMALRTGPPGLTFAFQNAGAVLPAILLFLLFGPLYDFSLNFYQLIGIAAVVVGLFLGARTKQPLATPFKFKKWILFATAILLLQGVILSIFQWRCLLYIPQHALTHPLIPWHCPPNHDVWFIPGFFSCALFLQLILFSKEKRLPNKKEMLYGFLGGVLNGIVTFCLLATTKIAVGAQKVILFPFFAVMVIFFCSLWGKAFYKEHVNYLAIALCIFGVFFSLC